MNYLDFLRTKIEVAPESGFDISLEEINPILKPHQRDAVKWAVKGGCRALFESFGLGKTIQALEICRIISGRMGGKALIVCPLGVRQEFKRDAETLLGISTEYVKTREEAMESKESILITNYERVRDGDIDPKDFACTVLDEASVLRSYGSKTYQTFLDKFKGVRFKFVCTATPSPNRYKELIHYAGYLEVMDTGQALTRFFQRDSTKANNLTVYPHKEEEFWLWISTWALFITKPSDLGYDDTGYVLPPLQVHYHEVAVDHTTAGADDNGQVKMFRDSAIGLKDAASEKRDSISLRIAKMMEIIGENPEDSFLLWHDLEDERRAIKRALPEACEVYGSLDMDLREQRVIAFSEGREKYLATKPEISGSGCNFQRHCHKQIFLGIGYKFNDFIQAIHRSYRFLQVHQVEIHVIYTESEHAILKTLLEKWEQHKVLVENMIAIVKRFGLSLTKIEDKLARTIGIDRQEVQGRGWAAVHNDCILETARMPENSVDLIHTSIPFSNHYEYTPSYNDFGHNKDNETFFAQMDFLTPELLRVLRPGRVAAIHVKDRILYGNATGTGMPTLDPFSDMTVFHFLKHGFQYFGRITIITDVVRENNQTYRLGYTEMTKDSTKMGVGCPEYILLFRKLPSDTSRAYADTRVTREKADYSLARWQIDAHAFWRSAGDRLLSYAELAQMGPEKLTKAFRESTRGLVYDYEIHRAIGERLEREDLLPKEFMSIAPGSWHPNVWDDVTRMRTLNCAQTRKQQINHVCPLQFDIVERIIERYSMPDELVMDPFGGLMTVPYMAVLMGRKGFGVELNPEYFKDGCNYLRAAEKKAGIPTLFDLTEEPKKAI